MVIDRLTLQEIAALTCAGDGEPKA